VCARVCGFINARPPVCHKTRVRPRPGRRGSSQCSYVPMQCIYTLRQRVCLGFRFVFFAPLALLLIVRTHVSPSIAYITTEPSAFHRRPRPLVGSGFPSDKRRRAIRPRRPTDLLLPGGRPGADDINNARPVVVVIFPTFHLSRGRGTLPPGGKTGSVVCSAYVIMSARQCVYRPDRTR